MSDADQQGCADITGKMAAMSLPSVPPAQTFYEYTTLPSTRHIRVMKLFPRPEIEFPSPFWEDAEPVHCCIKTVSLDEEPEYDALSYTWGNPINVFENEEQSKEASKIFENNVEITCDGKPLKITTNLHDALLAIRRIPRDAGFPDIADRPRAEYLWIDAISINQNDITERSNQVAIMDQIYSDAKITIVWLGRDDGFTRPATRLLKDLWDIPDHAIPLMKQQNGLQLYARDYASVGLRKISDHEWLSVYAFLNRNWFRRAWVLQELALSHRICVLNGLLMMDWAPIAVGCRVLETSKWYGSIEHTAECYMEGRSASAIINLMGSSMLDPDGRKPYLFRAEKNPFFNPARAINGITQVRSGLGIEDRLLKPTAYRVPLDFTSLMMFFRYSSSTEPRDKVYALCGILPQDPPGAGRSVQKIVPDYRKTVEQVYTEAAWFQLEWTNSLGSLGHVQDASKTRVENLPSWVPDYSVNLSPNSLSETWVDAKSGNNIRISPFAAADGVDFPTPLLLQPSKALSLQGVVYDIVADVGDFDNSYDLMTIVQLLAELPHIYWNDVLEHKRASSANGDDEDMYFAFEGGYLKEPDKAPDHQSSDTGSSSAAAVKDAPPHESAPRLQTFFEVLWRTLIADCWEGQHPAPLEAGYAFVESLIQDIKHLFYGSFGDGESTSSDDTSAAQDEQTKKLSAMKTLATCEFDGFTSVHWTNDAADERTYKSNKDATFATIPNEAAERMLTRFLPQFTSAYDLIFREVESSKSALWNVRFSQVMPGRKLFRTEVNRLLGTGPKSLEVGDCVCVLAGGTVPYLIRPIDGGRENKFRFVGEAYVHGIMHGEVVRGGGVEMQEIVLV